MAAAAMLPVTAQAADLRAKAPVAAAEPQLCKEVTEVNPDIFGFSSGTDVATPGSLALGLEYGGAFGTRSGSLTGSEGKVQLSFGFVPCIELGPSISFGMEHATTAFSPEDAKSEAIGGAIEAKFKLLGRAQAGVGMTLVFEPGWGRVRDRNHIFDDGGNLYRDSNSHDETSLASKILFDTVLIPDRLFLALNFVHEAAWVDVTPSEEESTFITSAALTLQASENFFIGVEGSYRHAYAGAWFDEAQGDAWFVGPTFLWSISENVALSGALAVQVAGSEKSSEDYLGMGDINLADFNQYEAKLKLGISF
ncbi:hypothetical protein BV133_962 [Blastochloris viridis]|nr:hypothetical protein BV133_962 [Blastochloris viridis]